MKTTPAPDIDRDNPLAPAPGASPLARFPGSNPTWFALKLKCRAAPEDEQLWMWAIPWAYMIPPGSPRLLFNDRDASIMTTNLTRKIMELYQPEFEARGGDNGSWPDMGESTQQSGVGKSQGEEFIWRSISLISPKRVSAQTLHEVRDWMQGVLRANFPWIIEPQRMDAGKWESALDQGAGQHDALIGHFLSASRALIEARDLRESIQPRTGAPAPPLQRESSAMGPRI